MLKFTTNQHWKRARQDTSGFEKWNRNLVIAAIVAAAQYEISRRIGKTRADSMVDLYVALAMLLVIFLLLPTVEFLWELLRAPKKLLAEQVSKLQSEVAARDNIIAARARDWNTEWKECADRFKVHANSFCRADWTRYSFKNEETWNIVGNDHIRSLCGLTGEMLLASPVISAALPEGVRLECNAINRWLTFLKTRGEVTQNDYVFEVVDDGTKHPINIGRIVNLANSSERVCIDCAATEFQIMRRQ